MKAKAFIMSLFAVLTMLLSAPAAHAADSRRIEAKPPTGSSSGAAYLNQGWHYTTGLDWDDEDGSGTCCSTGRQVYFRVWAYRSSSTFKNIAYAETYQNNTSTCVRARGRIKNYENGTVIGYLDYNHSNDNSGWYRGDIGASSSGGYTNFVTAYVQTESQRQAWETCGWSGPHVHAYHANGSSSWTRNTTNYDTSVPGDSGAGLYNDPISAPWERKISWSY